MLPMYIEDLFVEFYNRAMSAPFVYVQTQDVNACDNFYYLFINNKEITQNQSAYVLKILQKYKPLAAKAGLHYDDILANPKWKNSFRVIDMSKKVWVENSDSGLIMCLKFPYQLKAEFEKSFNTQELRVSGSWDPERKIRILPVYDYNPIPVYEFAKEHGFEIDDSLYNILGQVEEIWQNQESISPYSIIDNEKVLLVNSSEETDTWFNEHSTGHINDDLLLAKSMGYYYNGKITNKLEQIASSRSNSFWIKETEDFLSLTKRISGRIAIVLDRTSDEESWVRNFAQATKNIGFDSQQIRICFRKHKDEGSDFNRWVSENGFGGKVEGGKIFIFSHKPAKWLFTDDKPVTMLVTNNLYPATNLIAKDWFNSHPCVIYLGNIRPSELKEQYIVEL